MILQFAKCEKAHCHIDATGNTSVVLLTDNIQGQAKN